MNKSIQKTIKIWLLSALYFFVLSFVITILFLPGVERIVSPGDIGPGLLLVILAAAVCYTATAIFLGSVPGMVFPGASKRTIGEGFKTMPRLLAVLGIFIAIFAVISGFVSLFVFQAVYSGTPNPAATSVVNTCIAIIIILSLPLYIRAFSGHAGGEKGFRKLLSGAVRMGGLLYIKFLAIGVVCFGLSYLIRVLTGTLPIPASILIGSLLTALVLGAALLVSWRILGRKGAGK